MIRLIVAAMIAYFLIPAELRPNFGSVNVSAISTGEAIDAAGAVVRDIKGFCERNQETCETGSEVIGAAKQAVSTGIQKATREDGSETLQPANAGNELSIQPENSQPAETTETIQ
jgi:hypothetical protein